MLLLLLAYLGGVLTLLSPCILPVLPFVFARADRPFLRSTLPLLLGMALTFTVVATLAAVGSQWVVQANQIGRWIALLLMALFALALLWPRLGDRLLAPFQHVGARLSARADAADEAGRGGAWTPLLIGIATGLLWAPCAGPILGLVLTGAALQGASVGTTTLLLAYALGAVTALALAVWVGGRVFRALQARLGLGNALRRGLGVAALLAVVVIGLGWDTGLLTRLSTLLMESDTGAVLPAMLAAARENAEVREALERFTADRRTPTTTVLIRGIERGEIRADVDPELMADALVGAVIYGLLLRNVGPGRTRVAKLVDLVLAGAAA